MIGALLNKIIISTILFFAFGGSAFASSSQSSVGSGRDDLLGCLSIPKNLDNESGFMRLIPNVQIVIKNINYGPLKLSWWRNGYLKKRSMLRARRNHVMEGFGVCINWLSRWDSPEVTEIPPDARERGSGLSVICNPDLELASRLIVYSRLVGSWNQGGRENCNAPSGYIRAFNFLRGLLATTNGAKADYNEGRSQASKGSGGPEQPFSIFREITRQFYESSFLFIFCFFMALLGLSGLGGYFFYDDRILLGATFIGSGFLLIGVWWWAMSPSEGTIANWLRPWLTSKAQCENR